MCDTSQQLWLNKAKKASGMKKVKRKLKWHAIQTNENQQQMAESVSSVERWDTTLISTKKSAE